MKKLKVLMMAPVLDAGVILEDIGICYIASVLRENGFETKLVSEMAKNLDIAEIIEFQPDLLGISTYNQTIDKVYTISKYIKEKIPTCKICLGGTTATFYVEEILAENKNIDFVVIGEGEGTFLELAVKLEGKEDINNIKGLAYRQTDDNIIINERRKIIEDLDTLPFPSRDILLDKKLRIAMISSSRGCTHNCFFCCSNSFWRANGKFRWRGRSPKNIVDELEYLYKEHNIKQFWFTDPSFEDPGFNEERMKGIAQGIIDRGLHISYIVYFRASFYKKASDELMSLLIDSGLCSVFIGTESVNKYDLAVYGKKADVEDNVKVIEFFNKHNISVEIGFINFNPYSSFESLRENAEFLKKYKYYTGFHQVSRVMVFKGSRIYSKLKDEKLLKQSKYSELFSYEFIDSRIGELAEFISDYFGQLEKNSYQFEKISLLTHLYQSKLSHFKRNFCQQSNSKMAEIITKHENNLDKISTLFNDRVSQWYDKILDLAENNWSVEKAKELSDKTFNKEYLDNLVNDLSNEKIILIKTLAKIDKEYILYL